MTFNSQSRMAHQKDFDEVRLDFNEVRLDFDEVISKNCTLLMYFSTVFKYFKTLVYVSYFSYHKILVDKLNK